MEKNSEHNNPNENAPHSMRFITTNTPLGPPSSNLMPIIASQQHHQQDELSQRDPEQQHLSQQQQDQPQEEEEQLQLQSQPQEEEGQERSSLPSPTSIKLEAAISKAPLNYVEGSNIPETLQHSPNSNVEKEAFVTEMDGEGIPYTKESDKVHDDIAPDCASLRIKEESLNSCDAASMQDEPMEKEAITPPPQPQENDNMEMEHTIGEESEKEQAQKDTEGDDEQGIEYKKEIPPQPQPQENDNMEMEHTIGEESEKKQAQKDTEGDDEQGIENKKEIDVEQDEKDGAKEDEEPIIIGGSIDTPAFAMLAGRFEDPETSTEKTVSFLVNSVPSVLGRTQKKPSANFIDLGNAKALSRNHVAIYYTDAQGGKLGKYNRASQDEKRKDIRIDKDWTYRPPPTPLPTAKIQKQKRKFPFSPADNGYFAIECLGKNKIFVNNKRLENGQVARLSHKSTIQMASYRLYFLLPKDSSASPKTVSVPDFTLGTNDNSRSVSSGPPTKKARPTTPTKTEETRPLSELLSEFHQAIENDAYERKHALISRAIMVHAVEDICKDEILLKSCSENNGLSRAEIMDWIANHEKYSKWVVQQMTKLEMKSYQANLSKVMIQVGYSRIGTTGRHVKWMLPGEVMKNYKDSNDTKKGEEVKKDPIDEKAKEENAEDKKKSQLEDDKKIKQGIDTNRKKSQLENKTTEQGGNEINSQMEDDQRVEKDIVEDEEKSQVENKRGNDQMEVDTGQQGRIHHENGDVLDQSMEDVRTH